MAEHIRRPSRYGPILFLGFILCILADGCNLESGLRQHHAILPSASNQSTIEARSDTITPLDGAVVSWHEHTHLKVSFTGEDPNIDSANITLTSDLTGVISGTEISRISDDVRITLPKRDCSTGQGNVYHLCPSGERITAHLSGVTNGSGDPLPDHTWTFTVGVARILITNPTEGAYLNSTSIEMTFVVENHSIQLGGPHIHYMFDEQGASNMKMHTSTGPIRWTNLDEGYQPLILDMRASSHQWLGHQESITSINITVDTKAPSIEIDQINPAVDAMNVANNTEIVIRLSEQVSEHASITVSTAEGNVEGNVFSNLAGSKSEFRFIPKNMLASGMLHTVHIDGVADMAGNPMQAYQYSFTTLENFGQSVDISTKEEGFLERWGELILAGLAILASMIGWLLLRKRRAKVRGYLQDLDQIVESLGSNVQELETQIDRMKEGVSEDYRKGKIDEQQYQLVERKIEDARRIARQNEAEEVLGNLPSTIHSALQDALEDGQVDEEEVKHLLTESADLEANQKHELEGMLDRWREEDHQEMKHK